MLATIDRQRRRSCAVLAPVFRDHVGELRVLLIKRGAGGIHGGQLGFPGGKRERADDSLLETALRETEEEVGLARTEVKVLARLRPIDGLTSGLRVQGYLARITPPRRWRLADGARARRSRGAARARDLVRDMAGGEARGVRVRRARPAALGAHAAPP
jgi:8-oxo-dGTP pyrophosphatase MutT (NUDIX family)